MKRKQPKYKKQINHPLVLVYYVNLSRYELPKKDVISNIIKSLKNEKHDVIQYFLETTGENRIECLNPALYNRLQYKEVIKMLEKEKVKLDSI